MTFGEFVKQKRIEQKKSMRDLADEVGCSRTIIWQLEAEQAAYLRKDWSDTIIKILGPLPQDVSLLPEPERPLLTNAELLQQVEQMKTFGDVIRKRRLELGWTQAELAEKAGVPAVRISPIENKPEHRVRKDWCINLLKALDCILPEGIEYPDEPKARGKRKTDERSIRIPTRVRNFPAPQTHAPESTRADLFCGKHGCEIEPLIRNGCFKVFGQLNVSEWTTVEFDEPVMTIKVPAYFQELGLRFASFGELLAFGSAHPSVWEEKTVIAYGSQFKHGFWMDDAHIDTEGHSEFAKGGMRMGAALGKLSGGSKILCFASYEPIMFVRVELFEPQYPHIKPGTVILGVPKQPKERVLPKQEDGTLAEMRRKGLDEMFNHGLFEEALKAVTRAGGKLKETPQLQRSLLDAFYGQGHIYGLLEGFGLI